MLIKYEFGIQPNRENTIKQILPTVSYTQCVEHV